MKPNRCRCLILCICTALLSACGVETATTAASVGKLEAESAKNAQRTKEKLEQQLEQANALSEQRRQELTNQ